MALHYSRRWNEMRASIAACCILLVGLLGSGCASINHNANAVVFGGVCGAVGGVAGFAATKGNAEGAAGGAAVGATIGGAIGHQIDKLIWRKEEERNTALCPHCSARIHVQNATEGMRLFCPRCGRPSLAHAASP